MTVLLLVFGSFLLDFTCQTCLTPCEALLSDSSKGTDQSERCFTIYSVMVSIGGCVGYLITALDWSDSSIGLYFGTQERSVFVMLIILYSFSMLMTFGAAHEVPLAELQKKRTTANNSLSPTKTTDHGYVSDDIISEDGAANSQGKLNGDCAEVTYKIPMTKLSFTKFEGVRHFLALRLYAMLPDVIKSLFHVPYVLKRLAVANFCSWTAVMCFNLFYTNFVGQTIYGGDPNAPEDSELRALYDKGVRMGSWGLLLHCINSATYAAFIEKISARFDLRRAYLIGMITFVFSMLLMLISRDIYFVNFCATLTGFGYATLTTVPFMLVTNYHEKKEIFFYDTYTSDESSSTVERAMRGMGTDLAILDSAYFLSQVILTACMGYIVHFSGTALSYIICSSAMAILSCFVVQSIVLDTNHMQQLIKSNQVTRCITSVG